MGMPPQKHIVDSGLTTNASTAQTSFLLAKGIINPDPFTNNYECRSGSIIGAMTIQMDVTLGQGAKGAAGSPIIFDWGLFYNINDSQTAPTMDNAMGSAGADLINQLFHQDQTIFVFPVSDTTNEYRPHSWRVVVKIPKSYQKILRGDAIRLYFKFSQNLPTALKIRVIYKEYFP